MLQLFQRAEAARGLPAPMPGVIQPGFDPALFNEGDAAMDPALRGAAPGQPLVGPDGRPLEDPRPFRDRLLPNEDVRDDSEFTIVFAVVLDPVPPPPGDPNAPPPADPNAAPADPNAAPAPTPTAAATP
jgi:hypothetical protein